MCSDFGFDPLGLGEVPENLERYKESELIHCRWAMLAVVSFNVYFNIQSKGFLVFWSFDLMEKMVYDLVWNVAWDFGTGGFGIWKLGEGSRMGSSTRRTSHILGEPGPMGYFAHNLGYRVLSYCICWAPEKYGERPREKEVPGRRIWPSWIL